MTFKKTAWTYRLGRERSVIMGESEIRSIRSKEETEASVPEAKEAVGAELLARPEVAAG